MINSVLNRAKNTSSIAKLRIDDITIEDNQRIAENFNLYFSQIGSNLAKTITQGGKPFHDILTAPNDHSIFLSPINSEELLKIVRKLKTNKAPGYDGIDNIILKHIINYMLDPLVFLLNLSLQSGKVPSDMKIAKK